MEALLPMAMKNSSITQQYGSILSSYLMHIFLETRCITGLSCYYGNTVPDMFLRIIYISIFPFYCGNTVTHKNLMLTSRGNSLVRAISSSWISCTRSFSQMNTTTNNPLPSFGSPILHTLHCIAHVLYRVWRSYGTSQTLAALCNDKWSLFHCAFSIMFYDMGHRLFWLQSHMGQ